MSTPSLKDERVERARIEQETREFFTSYRQAFDQLDGDAVAGHFCVPSIMSMNGGFVAWTRREEIVENMRGLCETYRRHGFFKAHWELLDVVVQPPAHVFANVRWTVHRCAGRTLWSFRTSYTLRRDNEEWRVLLCTAYEEVGAPSATSTADLPNAALERTRE